MIQFGTTACLIGLLSILTPYDCFAQNSGILQVWGDDLHGQVSNAPSLSGCLSLAGGDSHFVAVQGDGTLVAWGSDNAGQCSNAPGGAFEMVAAGGAISAAWTAGGNLLAWGAFPVTASGVQEVAVGNETGIFIKQDGSLDWWGRNAHGVGNVPPGTDFVQISMRSAHALALRSDSTVAAWGGDLHYQVSGMPPGLMAREVACGHDFSLALDLQGTVVAWGNDAWGLISDAPTQAGFERIYAGDEWAIAIFPNGRSVGWGRDSQGQLSGLPRFLGPILGIGDPGGTHFLTAGWDSDQDGLADISEFSLGSDPFDQDTDDDGLSDGEEHFGYTPSPWQQNPGNMSWYALTGDIGWGTAKAWAGTLGASLTTIRNQSENDWLSNNMTTGPSWIGLTDESVEGIFEWLNGEPVTFTQWSPGEPSGNYSDADGVITNHLSLGDWDDRRVTTSVFPAIVERSTAPIFLTDPLLGDTDRDGISDGIELGLTSGWPGDPAGGIKGTDPLVFIPDADPTTFTNPMREDTDGGGSRDGWEDVDRDGALTHVADLDPLDPADDSVNLTVPPLVRGQFVTLVVDGVRKDSATWFCYSTAGIGVFTHPTYGFTMGLAQPITALGKATATSAGSVGYSATVPISLPIGLSIWFQAVEAWGRPPVSFRVTDVDHQPIQ